ncbi:hypothetical protein [Photobacterium angustum]|uniref:hypothetical protein n=1 Tax=Photobacterium angustum TaxID=661 RepID=UPI0011B2A066|nr:hypothetical protein [Photobacterium angustum]
MKQNATATTKGFIYQFYEAIDWCWQLEEGQTLYIETFGDISISNESNIEVKNVAGNLTNMGDSFWKTLRNWLDDGFDEKEYKKFILITTQEISSTSLLFNWNTFEVNKRINIIKDIIKIHFIDYNKSELDYNNGKIKNKPKVNKYISMVSEYIESEKLLNIVSKFLILDSSLIFEERYKQICDIYGKTVLRKNVESFIYSQIGFIISPASTSNNWAITYEDFRREIDHLVQIYASGSRVFPKIKTKDTDLGKYGKYLFVRKIEDIKYTDVIDSACADYARSLSIISESFSHGEPKNRYDDYLQEVMNHFDTLYRMKSRRCSNNIDFDSQDFYDEHSLHSPPPFSGYDSTGTLFRNGVLHIQLDDKSKNKKWRLK